MMIFYNIRREEHWIVEKFQIPRLLRSIKAKMTGNRTPSPALVLLIVILLINPYHATSFSISPSLRASIGGHRTSCTISQSTTDKNTGTNSPRISSRLDVKINPRRQQRKGLLSPLRNLPLEDALEIELLEMEAELDLAKPRDSQPPPQIKATDAVSIIAGTAIGGGFLALPSVTSPLGYGPASLGLILAWTFLLLSATAFIEAAGLVADVRNMENGVDDVGGVSTGTDIAVAQEGATSVATVIRYAFGKRVALVGGSLFIAQVLAVVTAQVVKGAELFSDCLGIPYLLGCLVPTSLAGLFAFGSEPEVVERANTALTLMMVGGFAALIIGTVATGNVGKAAGAMFSRADYGQLLPRPSGAWSLPVFINILCFGQSMPLVVERMVQGSSTNGGIGEEDDDNAKDRAPALLRARSATFLGAVVPLLLTVIWVAISTALVKPSISNPLAFLLSRGPTVAIPVGLLAAGAIGTTLLGSFLAMGHFASDIVCMKLGYCSLSWMKACNAFTVVIPSILACIGPALYVPLLSFSGAYPTTILHGLAPALAAIVLRRRVRRAGIEDGALGTTPRIVPGGDVTLVGLAGTAIGLVGASTWLALRHFVRG